MTFRKIAQPKLSDVIAQQLEAMILEGSLQPGEKLLSERELSVQFDVSRPSLREAIQKLEAKGILERKQGGGTFVKSQLWGSLSDPIAELMSNNPESQFDLLEFRHATEGMMAYYAAMRGTQDDVHYIQNALEKVQQSSQLEQQAQAILDFYRTIAEASHNAAMLHLELSLAPLLMNNIKQNLVLLEKKSESLQRVAEHRQALVNAISDRNPEAARDASNEHLAYIEELLLNVRQEESRHKRSLRRRKRNT